MMKATDTTAIATTTTSSTPSHIDNIIMIKERIENTTEGLPLTALAIFLIGYYLHPERTL
jgi:hypothetical protein